jgi:hypothetical protein
MAPNLDFRGRWCLKSQDLNGEDHPLQEELLGSNAAQDHHPIAAVLVPTLELVQDQLESELSLTPVSSA